MRHAYLILCHNEMELLALLVQYLDDKRNDIFIHIDKKVKQLPSIITQQSNLYFLENRVDITWGNISMLYAEFNLFEYAYQTNTYDYYHLLSGVDLPLWNQDIIHAFFNKHKGKEFIGFSQYDYKSEIDRKVNKFHLFPKKFRASPSFSNLITKILRASFLRLQILIGYSRNKDITFKKGPQWVSVTAEFTAYLLANKLDILKMYRNTFCADEIFIQTLCWNSPFRKEIYNTTHESDGCQRIIGWKNGTLIDWNSNDYTMLTNSSCLFARKFNSIDKEFLQAIEILQKRPLTF